MADTKTESTDPFVILEEINSMIQEQQDLYKTLEASYATGTDDEYAKLISQINTIAGQISDKFRDIQNSYEATVLYNSSKKAELAEKIQQAKAIEQDLLDRKKLQHINETAMANKIRTVEINTYYSSTYSAQAEIMKVIIIICAPLLIITLLSKSNILPANIADVLMALVIIIGAGVVTFKIYDLLIRNNMNFDQYDWGNPSNTVSAISDDTVDETVHNASDYLIHPGCVDASCCSVGTYFDKSSGQCLTGDNPLEGFDCIRKKKSIVPFNSTQTNFVYVNK